MEKLQVSGTYISDTGLSTVLAWAAPSLRRSPNLCSKCARLKVIRAVACRGVDESGECSVTHHIRMLCEQYLPWIDSRFDT